MGDNGRCTKYWNGLIILNGEHGKKKWELMLDVGVWSQAMQRFLSEFEFSDAAHYVGQDWY